MTNAVEELKGPVGFNWRGYSSAANYTLTNKVQMDKGLEWIELALAQAKNFTNLNIKSGLLQEAGKSPEAEKIKKEDWRWQRKENLTTMDINCWANHNSTRPLKF